MEALATRRASTGITELAGLVGLHVSTVHRLLATLVDRGYVRQDPETSRYHLGARVFSLANAADSHLDLRLVARPYLERLMRAAGETANLVTGTRDEVVYLDQIECEHLVKMFTRPGMRAPLHSTGSGKVLMAFRRPDQIDHVLAGPLRQFTRHTIAGRAALEKELAGIRRDGFAIDNEEMEDGVRCVAVPIFDRRNEVVGALSVSGPISRMTPERAQRIAPNAKQISAELSRQLGFETQPVAPLTNGAAAVHA